MARAAPKPVFSLKLFKQFAVATVVLTALIAFAADGDSRAAVAETVEGQQQASQLAASEAGLAAQGKGGNSAKGIVLVDKRGAVGSFGDDSPMSVTETTISGPGEEGESDWGAPQTFTPSIANGRNDSDESFEGAPTTEFEPPQASAQAQAKKPAPKKKMSSQGIADLVEASKLRSRQQSDDYLMGY